jgi:NAD(P)-dependent dehydrogenase (short-subunit alcohol dehydrogenase family)
VLLYAHRMKKPTTLITGAGVRIGAEIARHLAAHGHDLVLHYHNSKAEAEALAADLRAAHGATVTLVMADLEDSEALAQFWDGLPKVTTLIHNAARFMRDDMASATARGLRSHLAVNLEAPLLLAQGFLAQLPAGEVGDIIILGDGSKGWSIAPEFFTYAVSKLAWESVIDLLAAAVAPRARANVIALAPTLPNARETEAMYARLASHAPLKRNSSTQEVCSAIDFLRASPGVTGQTISLAAGFGLATKRPAV